MIILKVIPQSGHCDRTYLHFCDFPVAFQWGGTGNDLIPDLRSPNKEILDMHIVIVLRLTQHAKFQNHRSKSAGPSEGQNLTCITSVDCTW